MTTFRFRRSGFSLALLAIASASPVFAGEADVIAVKAVRQADESVRFDVTIRHDDSGWDHYADRFEIVAPDGTVLDTRVLLHPHENEQPFTRSLLSAAIPAGVMNVTVRAHDSIHGFGGAEVAVSLPE